MQAIHYVKKTGTDAVTHLICNHKVDPKSKAMVCEVLPPILQ